MRTKIKKPLSMLKTVFAEDLAEVFNQCFKGSECTVLCVGASEPFYVPQNIASEFSCGKSIDVHHLNRVFSREDYPASVLHEAAHWCIAGDRRRKLLDYGYWYEPDGRDVAKQAEFERFEVKPQALERIMSCAADMPFRLSADNANDPSCRPSEDFVQAVQQQTLAYIEEGLPSRARQFVEALDQRFTGDRSYAKLCSYVVSNLL
jgi:elongation factor P hydroxylase